MMKLKILPVLLLITQLISAQNFLQSKSDVAKHADKVMSLFGTSNYEDAFEELRKHYIVADIDFQNIKYKTTDNISTAEQNFGKIRGEIFIKEEILMDIALRRNYVVKLGKILLRFRIGYYHSDQGWIVNSFNWDDEYEEFYE